MDYNNLVSSDDIKEIDNLLDFSSNIIIKDSKLADSLENNNSYIQSNLYINAKLGVDDNTDSVRQDIIKNYIEYNSYYKDLYEKYGIDYFTSRMASDLNIIKVNKECLSKEEKNLFYQCYYESLDYYKKVIYTKAFTSQSMYSGFIKLYLIFSTVQRYLSRKMDNFFNIDTYSLKTLKNSFISVGLDYFDDIPIDYQRRILKMINILLSNKGTNKCITEIINIFGFDKVNIYKYILAKGYREKSNNKLDYKDPYLLFLKVPVNETIDFNKNLKFDFDTIVSKDPYWDVSKEEILDIPFNFVNSKYISIDADIDILKETIDLSYFMSLLKNFELNYKNKESLPFGFIDKNISTSYINIFDSIVALQSIVLRSQGFKDNIIENPDSINYIYGYNDIENKIDIKNIIDDTILLLKRYKNSIVNYNEIINFFESFKLENFNEKNNYSIDDFLKIFNDNQSIRKQLENLIQNSENYDLYKQYLKLWNIKMKSNTIKNIYENESTYLDYLKKKNYDLYKYIILPDLNYTDDQKNNFYKERIFELTDDISNYISDGNIRRCFLYNNFIGLIDYIENYLYTLVSIFKSYTIELLSTNIIFNFDDKTFNTLKLFDKFRENISYDFVEREDLLDIFNFKEKNYNLKDNYNINDKLLLTINTNIKDNLSLNDKLLLNIDNTNIKDNLSLNDNTIINSNET